MKVLSIVLCLSAMAFAAVEAVPRQSGAHFVARMLHNNKAALLQRRGDPNSPTCKQAEANGRDSMDTLTAAIQDYDDPAVALTQKFQNALFKAYDNRNDAALAAIEDAYSKAKAAANNASGPQAQSLRDALDDMISKARIAGDACKV